MRGYASLMGVEHDAFQTLACSIKSSSPSVESAADAILALEASTRTPIRRQVIFDAVRASSAGVSRESVHDSSVAIHLSHLFTRTDGYTLSERHGVRELAMMLHIPVEMCRALEQAYTDERFIKTRRSRLCYPDGLPF